MTIAEVLQIVNRLVEKQTGEHLDDLEKAVVKGLWQGKSYSEIADECGYESKNYIGDVSRKLYKILSEQLNEDVKKSNFSWTLERVTNSPQFVGVNTNITLCQPHPPIETNSSVNKDGKISEDKDYYDLTLAPKITHFYDRATELQTLSHWLTNQNPRLISVLGLPGIGKTTFVKQFVDLNLEQFDVVIWKSIKLSPSLDNILTEIITYINPDSIQADNKLTQFFNLLRQQRCLIVFDDTQELFVSQQFAGQYKDKYKEYKTFFTKVTEIEHQSSLILISQEQCPEMLCLDEELYPIKCLVLRGLNNTEILRDWGLQDEENWSKLVDLYAGNPAYLKNIANLIKNIFGGKVAEFLKEDTLIITKDMKYILAELFQQISPIEQQIVLHLSESDRPVSREDLRQNLSLSSTDLMNGLQSLTQHYLLNRIEENKILFDLPLVFKEYVKSI